MLMSSIGVREQFGQYEIYDELGAGGLARVHLARTHAGKEPVALKRLHPHILNVPELVESFIDEARLARHLKHPGIARVFEYGRLRDTYFIAFEFVPGPTLQQLWEHCNVHVGRIPIPVVLEIVKQVCDALEHAHNLRDESGARLDIVHRDVTPTNVIVSSTGQVKLIDFGLAKTKQSTVQSQAGIIKGKLNYVAPEYLSGKLDARCDLWALGVVMHELLTGMRLFDSHDQSVILDRVRSMEIPPPSRLNPEIRGDVDRVVMSALERDPDRRWSSAAAMRAATAQVASSRLTKHQLVTWIEWAFSQKQKLREEHSSVSALAEILRSDQIEVVGQLPAISEAMEVRRRESVAMMPLSEALPQRPPAGRGLWIAVALMLVIGAGFLAAYQLS
jgi:serine/threonine protein kinase